MDEYIIQINGSQVEIDWDYETACAYPRVECGYGVTIQLDQEGAVVGIYLDLAAASASGPKRPRRRAKAS
jgi:hypothetical protein